MRKINIKLITIITIAIALSLSVTYAYIELGVLNNTATGEGGCFEVNYQTATTISGANFESSTTYVAERGSIDLTLSKTAECDIYNEATIYLNINTSTTTAPLCREEDEEGYTQEACSMKYQIMKNDEFIELPLANSSTIGTIKTVTPGQDQALLTVELTTTPTTYKIYFWIDSNTSNGIYDGKTFSGNVYASATQSSTVSN